MMLQLPAVLGMVANFPSSTKYCFARARPPNSTPEAMKKTRLPTISITPWMMSVYATALSPPRHSTKSMMSAKSRIAPVSLTSPPVNASAILPHDTNWLTWYVKMGSIIAANVRTRSRCAVRWNALLGAAKRSYTTSLTVRYPRCCPRALNRGARMRKHMYTPTPAGIQRVANQPLNHASHAIPSTEYALNSEALSVKKRATPPKPFPAPKWFFMASPLSFSGAAFRRRAYVAAATHDMT
mmetsp:Transcript_12540/g.20294  ORF Transcript_12540/g.20294 Transcript_12540/m.20294 type:complete len:240 (+) Transcript_12540:1354-2073(+)